MSRTDFGPKSLAFPQPVFVIAAYDDDGHAHAMIAAWAGISGPGEISLCLSPAHMTVKYLRKTGAFTVSTADAAHMTACDYLGIVSSENVQDKLTKAGFTLSKSQHVNAPIINELAICLECRVKNYDPAACRLVGEIINVSVDDSVVADGQVDVSSLRPLVLDPFTHAYRVVGETIGIAFEAGKKLI